MTIKDHGKGFDEEGLAKGNGLDNMKHRAQEAGGTLDVKSVPGEGTTISLSVPV